MKVEVRKPVRVGDSSWGYIITKTFVDEDKGRVLVVIRTRSRKELITLPVGAVEVQGLHKEWQDVWIREGRYDIIEGHDSKGCRLWRMYYDAEEGAPSHYLVSVEGWARRVEGDVKCFIEMEGSSRTGRHGNRFSLLAISEGAMVVVTSYYGETYVARCEDGELRKVAEGDVPPSEW